MFYQLDFKIGYYISAQKDPPQLRQQAQKQERSVLVTNTLCFKSEMQDCQLYGTCRKKKLYFKWLRTILAMS